MANTKTVKETVYRFDLVDGFTKGLAAIGRGVSGLTKELANLNQTSELIGKGFSAITSAATGLLDSATGAGQLEDALERVRIKTGATSAQMEGLQVAIDAALADTRFSTLEAAQALGVLADSGLSATQAADQLGKVLAFAQANALGAADAAGSLADTLDQFGASADQIGPLADALTATATAAGTTGKQLQDALLATGVAAEQAGLGIDQTVAALGALATAGIEGGKAGQRLQLLLQQLADPASQAGEALRSLGLDASNFGSVIARLSTDGAAAEQVLTALGNRPRQALQALLADGGSALQDFTAVVQGSAGAAQAAADALNNTFAGALTRLTNQLTAAREQFLQPLLRPLADEFTALSARISTFVASAQFDAISQQFKTFVLEGVNGLVTAIGQLDFDRVVSGLQAFGNAAISTAKAAGTLLVFLGDAVAGLDNLVTTIGTVITGQGKLDGTLFSTAERLRNVAIAAAAANFDFVELARLNSITAEEFAKTAAAAALTEQAVITLAPQVNQLAGTQAAVSESTRKWKDETLALVPELLKAKEGVDGVAAAATEAQIGTAQLAPNFNAAGQAANIAAESARKAAFAFSEVGANAEASGDQIVKAYGEAVKNALNADAVNKLQVEFAKLGNEGRVSIEQLTQGANVAADRLRELSRVVSQEVTAAFRELGVVSQLKLDEDVKKGTAAFQELERAVGRGEASISDLRAAFIALAQRQLDSVRYADEFKRAQVEAAIRARAEALGVVDALQQLGLAGQQAGAQVEEGATRAAAALEGIADAAGTATGSIQGLGSASAAAGEAVTYTTGAIVKAGGELRGYSIAALAAANSVESLGFSSRRIGEQVEAQQRAVAELTRRYREQAAATDPVEQALDRLARQYPLVARESLRAAAEQEAAANRSTAAINGTTAALQRQQQVTQSTSSVGSPGGATGSPTSTGLTGRPASPNQPQPQFQQPAPQQSVTFNAVVADDRDLEQLVRRAEPILRRVLRLGNALSF